MSAKPRPDVEAGTTTAAIRNYLKSVQPGDDPFTPKYELRYQRGRGVIEAFAATASGADYPKLKLSAMDCSDVLLFMQMSGPIDKNAWWIEGDEPSQLLGEHFLFGAISNSVADLGSTENVTPISPAIKQLFNQAALPVSQSIALLERAQDMTERDSDTEGQCHEDLEELRGALQVLEWVPSADD